LYAYGLILGFAQGWQQHRRQNGNNSDHHKQFNQGEAQAIFAFRSTTRSCNAIHTFIKSGFVRGFVWVLETITVVNLIWNEYQYLVGVRKTGLTIYCDGNE
jgi:hypothetical protein